MMTSLLNSGEKLDIYAFNAVIMGFSRMAKKMTNPRARYEAAEKAETLALVLLEQYDEICVVENDIDDKDLEVYWSKQLTISFNIALNAWARSDVKEAGPRVDVLWQLMLEDPLLQPNRISMNSVIKTWARAFNPIKAQEILNFVSDLYESGTITDSEKPDAVSYSTVMSAWAKSNIPEKTVKARQLLDTMLIKYEAGDSVLKPSLVAFTTVLNAASNNTLDENKEDSFGILSAKGEEIYNIALQTYNEVLDDTHHLGLFPDSLIFAAMLKVIAIHVDASSAERRHIVQTVFDDACNAGQVSSFVIKELRLASPDIDLLTRLLGSENLVNHLPSINLLPTKWIKGVPNQPRFQYVDKRSNFPRK